MDDDSWERFEAACEWDGVHPATKLRTLAEWYYRKSGVTIRRPPAAWKADRPKVITTPAPNDH
jgi:hypothetical protein